MPVSVVNPARCAGSEGLEALLSLLDNTACNQCISGAPASVQTAAARSSERSGLRCERPPSLDRWLTVDAATTPRYPYRRPWEEALRDPLFVVHSFGAFLTPSHIRDLCLAPDMESGLERHPLVATALVGGEGRLVPFVILELRGGGGGEESAEKMEDFKEQMGALIGEVNGQVVGQVRIPRDNVVVADAARPFGRLGKGTLDRIGVLADYKVEIEKLYSM